MRKVALVMAHSPTDQERKVRAALRRAAGLPARWSIQSPKDRSPLPDDVDYGVELRDFKHVSLGYLARLGDLEDA